METKLRISPEQEYILKDVVLQNGQPLIKKGNKAFIFEDSKEYNYKYCLFEDNSDFMIIDKKQNLISIFKSMQDLQKFAEQNNLIITN
jgi:hypothetical protein